MVDEDHEMGEAHVRTIQIPIRDSQDIVELPVNELPSADQIIGLLKSEYPPLDLWLECAIEYHKQGRETEFEDVLISALDTAERNYSSTEAEGRMKILNSLAGHYIEKSKLSGDDTSSKESYLTKASNLIKNAEKTDQLHSMTFVTKGVMYLNQGEYQRAMVQFDAAVTSDNNNIPAMLGKACILYNQKQYEEALKLYQKALQINGSNAPPAVRLGIGLCYYNLGNLRMARAAFDRVLQLEDNANALVANAILDLNSPSEVSDETSKNSHIEKAMKSFTRAYRLDPSNPMVLNHLSNHFFYNNMMDKVQTLSSNAYKNSRVEEVKAESCYNIARCFHAQGNYEAAFSHYYRIAVHQWPDFVLGRYGLGQLYIQRGELDKAMTEYQGILLKEPENFETNKIIGALYAEKGKFTEALKYFKTAHSINPNDEQVLVEISQFEHANPQAALDALLKAKQIMELKGHQFPYELWNNLGALYHKLGDIKGASSAYTKALQEATIDVNTIDSVPITLENVTLLFNYARFLQDSHKTDQARRVFIAILKEHVGYYECYMALALISHEEGDNAQALAYLKAASALFPKESAAFSAMGYIYMSANPPNYNLAQKQYDHIVQNIDPLDGTALVALGTIYFTSATQKAIDQAKAERYLQYATNNFERALKNDKYNMYAALSLGAVMAQRGYLDDARDIFIKVQESSSIPSVIEGNRIGTGIPETWLNLAHVWMCQKQYQNAAKLYQKCLTNFYDSCHVPTLHCLAAACFEAKKLPECKTALQNAIHISPNDVNLWYDLAVAHYEHCVHILKSEKPSVSDTKKALEEIKRASDLFKYVAGLDQPKLVPKAQEFLTVGCQKTQKRAQQMLEKAERDERTAREIEQQKIEAMKKLDQEAKQKKQEAEQKKKDEEELRKKRAVEHQELMNRLQAQWALSKPQKSADPSSLDDIDNEEKGGKKRKRKTTKKKKEKEEDEEEEASDDGRKTKKKSVKKEKKTGRLKKTKDKKNPKKKRKVSDEEEEAVSPVPETGSVEPSSSKLKEEKVKEEPADEEMEQGRAISDGEEEFDFGASNDDNTETKTEPSEE